MRPRVTQKGTTETDRAESLARAEIVAYVEESQIDESKCILKLSNLIKMYADRLHEIDENTCVSDMHSTRFKESFLEICPYLKVLKIGREV